MNEKLLSTYLKRLGCSPALKGYYLLYRSTILVLEDPNLLNSITRRLYPILAAEFRISITSVERRIRYAIEYAWLNGDYDFISEVFEYSLSISKSRPTNSQFIYTLAEFIRLEMIFNNGNGSF